MNIVFVLELLAAIFLAWLIATQVFIPLMLGRPVFPMFGRMPKLQDELSRVRQRRDEQEVETQIAEEKSKLEKKGKKHG